MGKPHTILTVKKATVAFGEAPEIQTFPGAIQNANITVTEGEVAWPAIDGMLYANEDAQYVLNLDLGQDFSGPDTLFMYLWDHSGEKVPFVLTPDPTTDAEVTPAAVNGTVVLRKPSQIGGARGVATATAALRVEGDVSLVPDDPA